MPQWPNAASVMPEDRYAKRRDYRHLTLHTVTLRYNPNPNPDQHLTHLSHLRYNRTYIFRSAEGRTPPARGSGTAAQLPQAQLGSLNLKLER